MRPGASFVISVGNIALGGRGKTPLVGLIARLLIDAGERPAILSRGYGRRIREDGVTIVSDGTHLLADIDRAGDEPLMLARAVPGAVVLVCEQRAVAAALAESRLRSTVHILDDGFQHRAMRRDVDIVAITPEDLGDRRVPFGRLREPPSALRRADALIVEGAESGAPVDGMGVSRVFAMTRHIGNPVAVDALQPVPSRDAPVVAVAAIAAPDRFSRALEQAGWRVSRLLGFRDHHRYRAGDVRQIARVVQETGAAGVLTTEKDAMRLRLFRPFSFALAHVPLTVCVEPRAAFEGWLLDCVRERHA